ncbi:cholesterol 24-hydroxylase-like [Anneissia japonica]|uniref:cholesterol 24-hydroxylase-like n=1 Tax=Anneissia japonica TaxID=1529436 RepID=UPI001425772C|nr:cholesterol 24-hydroxylase-like [Anneissia japonica]XP_033124343.1 cholesterol 24-hydroxylase-like [Anneissia japonica]
MGAALLLIKFIGVGILVLSAAILGFAAYIVYNRRKYAHIPQPKLKSFFGGHLGILHRGRDCTAIIECWIKAYGSILCMHTYHLSRILVYDPAIVKEILRSEHKKPRYSWFENIFGERFLGRSLLTETDHQKWASKRSRLNKAFHKSSLKQMVHQFDMCARGLLDHLKTLADGKQVIPMAEKFMLLTQDIIAKVGFGLDLGVYAEDGLKFDQALSATFRLKWVHFLPQWFSYPPFGKSRKQRRLSTSACRMIRSLGRECILKRMDDMRNGHETPIDLLHFILQEYTIDKSSLTGDWFERIVDEFVTFFIAGNETTAGLLSFTVLLLGTHPDVQAKVQNEIDNVIGRKENIEYQDLLKLKYLSMVFKEALRLHPPVNSAIRITSCEVTLNGYTCPKGTFIQCPHAHLSKLERFYKDPLNFYPERWADPSCTESANFNYQYFPFSAGLRTCIGKEFALIEARLLMARMMETFNIRLEKQTFDVATVGGTIRPRDGCIVTLTLRE